ncbi:MAG: carboxylesterase family protein, partial [Pseudonocardia sp.]
FYERAGIPVTEPGLQALLAAAAGTRSEVGAAYPANGRSPDRVWSDVITDRAYACTELLTSRALAERGPVFAYEFADPAAPSPILPLPPDLAGGATHGSELPYLFDLVAGQPPLTADQQALADELVDRWARFAATGNPNGGAATPWPQWTGDGQVLTITGPGAGTTVRPAAEFAADHRCALWGLGGPR